jgi:hypothetical protein
MRTIRAALGAALLASSAASAEAGPMACEREMTRAAAATGVPLNVLYSVGLTETGRRGQLEPYDLNIDGREVRSDSLAEAMARFAAAKAGGAKLIDIGCMQINAHCVGGLDNPQTHSGRVSAIPGGMSCAMSCSGRAGGARLAAPHDMKIAQFIVGGPT